MPPPAVATKSMPLAAPPVNPTAVGSPLPALAPRQAPQKSLEEPAKPEKKIEEQPKPAPKNVAEKPRSEAVSKPEPLAVKEVEQKAQQDVKKEEAKKAEAQAEKKESENRAAKFSIDKPADPAKIAAPKELSEKKEATANSNAFSRNTPAVALPAANSSAAGKPPPSVEGLQQEAQKSQAYEEAKASVAIAAEQVTSVVQLEMPSTSLATLGGVVADKVREALGFAQNARQDLREGRTLDAKVNSNQAMQAIRDAEFSRDKKELTDKDRASQLAGEKQVARQKIASAEATTQNALREAGHAATKGPTALASGLQKLHESLSIQGQIAHLTQLTQNLQRQGMPYTQPSGPGGMMLDISHYMAPSQAPATLQQLAALHARMRDKNNPENTD